MSLKIIDLISEAEDREDVNNDWSLLVTPLAEAVKIDVEENPARLYILPESEGEYIITKEGDTKEVSYIPSDIYETKLQLGVHRNKPILLVGEAGVGKTSWIYFFMKKVITDRKLGKFHYNQKSDYHLPISLGSNEIENFERIFWYTLLLKVKKWLFTHQLTGNRLYNIECEDIVEYGKKDFVRLFNVFRESMSELYDKKSLLLFIFIDNIDQYPKSLQMKAFDTAVWLAATRGIVSFVTLRPDTLHHRMFDKKVHDPIIYSISPPSLRQYLSNRKRYLWECKSDIYLKDIRELLESKSTSFNLSYTGVIDYTEDGLKRLHTNIVRAVTQGKVLESAIYAFHNNNFRDIAKIVSSILKTAFFASEFKVGSVSEPIPRLKRPEKIITAYLRGMFRHYRPGTAQYPVKNINIFDETQITNSELILSVRLLQYLFARKNTVKAGIKYVKLKNTFKKLGYADQTTSLALVYLNKKDFITETVSQKDIEDPEEIKRADRFRLTELGNYVITRMMSEYAFRYCEAIADNMPRARTDGKMWQKDKSFLSLIENAFGVLELIIESAESEKARVLRLAKENENNKALITEYYNEYFDKNSPTGSIIQNMSKECITRANFLSKYLTEEPNYDGAISLKQIKEDRIPNLKRRVDALVSFEQELLTR